MEGEEAVTRDKSEQMPSDSGKMNGEAPDTEEPVVLNADGSEEVGVNGENGEKDLNVSLDTQTQTREEEFPPDHVPGGGVGEEPRENGTQVEENGTLEEGAQEGNQKETGEEDATVVNEQEIPSESPERPAEVKENGQAEPANSEKESSPKDEEAVSTTLGSVQVVGTTPSNVDHLVNVDDHHHHNHPHVMEFEPTPTHSGTETGGGSTVQDNVSTEHDTGTGNVEVSGDVLEPCTEHTRAATLNDKQTITITTNIPPQQTPDNSDTCNNDPDTYMPNIPGGQERPDHLDHSKGLIQSEKAFSGEESDQVIVNREKEPDASTGAYDTDTSVEGSGAVIGSLQADVERSPPVEQNEDKQPNSIEVGGSVECQSDPEPTVPNKETEVMSLVQADIDRLDGAEKALIESKVDAIFGATGEEIVSEEQQSLDQDKSDDGIVDPGSGGFVEGNISVESESNLESASPVGVERDVNANLSGEVEPSSRVPGEGEFVVNYVDDVVNRAMEQYITSGGDSGQDVVSQALDPAGVSVEAGGGLTVPGDSSQEGGSQIPREVQEESVGAETCAHVETVPDVGTPMDATGEACNVDSVVQNEAFSEHREQGVEQSHEESSPNIQIESTGLQEPADIQKAEPSSPFEKTPATNNVEIQSREGIQNKRWSAPVSQLPERNLGSVESHSENKNSDSGQPKFRPVKFRAASSSSSQDAKWRRTSLGVPRGWKAPPVDILPPTAETNVPVASSVKPSEQQHEPEVASDPPSLPEHQAIHIDTSHTSPEPSDISSLSSPSLLSPAASDVSSEGRNVYRAEPVTVTEEVGGDDPAHSPVSYPTDTAAPNTSVSPTTQGIVTVHPPAAASASPVASTAPGTKRTPPMSQRVPVYEMKEPPTSPSSGGANTKRQAFGQSRSMTTGDVPKKLSKAEEERQQVLAALRVKRPVKAKWQGQIELEEKEKESKIVQHEDFKSVSSAQKYEERKKQLKSKSFDTGSGLSELSIARPRHHSGGESGGSRPHSLTIDASSEGSIRSELDIPRDEALSPNGDTCSSGYTSGRSTPAGEDASRNLSLPKASGLGVSMYKEYQSLLEGGDSTDQSTPINEETGLKQTSPREPGESYVKSAVKLREKKGGSKVNSHVVKQSRISFVEQEVLRSKQQEEEYRREREQREQELKQQPKPPVPPPAARLQSPTSPEPPAVKPAPAKPVHRPANSKAKAVYQELNYNPKTGGGNRSNAMVKDWENKFDQ